MTLSPFLYAPLEIQVHMGAAIFALLLGPFVIYRPRRDLLHRTLGYLWVTSMGLVALSSFAISSNFTPFGLGPLHILSIITLWSLWSGVLHAIHRRVQAHQAVFRSLYSNGLLIAGAFTFMPGRTINRMVFGEAPELGWLVIATALAVVFARIATQRRRVEKMT